MVFGSDACNNALIPVPQRCIMGHEASQAGSSGQPPSQHGSAAAAISAVKLADTSKDVAPSRVTASKSTRKGRSSAVILVL